MSIGPDSASAATDSGAEPKSAPAPRATRVPMSRVLLFATIAIAGLTFDLTTKTIAFERIGEPGAPIITVIPDILELQTSYNTGALWAFGNSWAYSSLVFASLSIVAAFAIVYWLFVRGGATDRPLTIALGLIMAGALGNCYDRVFFGKVRDFVHFHVDAVNFDCAIFNFADNMLIAGAVLLMLIALRLDPEPESTPAPANATVGSAAEGEPAAVASSE